jgi:hypothetical protein
MGTNSCPEPVSCAPISPPASILRMRTCASPWPKAMQAAFARRASSQVTSTQSSVDMSIISMAPSFSAAAANEIGVLKRPPLQIQSLEASPEPEPPFRRGHGRTLVPRKTSARRSPLSRPSSTIPRRGSPISSFPLRPDSRARSNPGVLARGRRRRRLPEVRWTDRRERSRQGDSPTRPWSRQCVQAHRSKSHLSSY